MSKKELEDVIKYFCDNNDYITAKNHIISHGSQIKGYDVNKELKKIDKLITKKESKDKGG